MLSRASAANPQQSILVAGLLINVSLNNGMTRVFLVDDHNLLRNGMAQLVDMLDGYTVIGQAANGKEFIERVDQGHVPDVVILDIQMPVMNGEQTALWLKANRPEVKILVLTMHDDEQHILRMIRAGANGYILKNTNPDELKEALDSLRDRGTYHTELVSETLKNLVTSGKPVDQWAIKFSERELEFIRLACSDLSYKEIATKMGCSARTVDSYRDGVFAKLGINTRISLALFAIKHNLATVQ